MKITDTLYLKTVDLPAEQARVHTPVHHLWIIDRSGSMGWTIKPLIDDLIKLLSQVDLDDHITVGWYSSENGQYGWLFENKTLQDQGEIVKKLKSAAYTLGCTCFSEVLQDAFKRVPSWMDAPTVFNFMLFTDGCPVVSNYANEVQAIMNALQGMTEFVGTSILVGYGDYYNRQLMAQMAQIVGGSLIHAEQLSDLALPFRHLVDSHLSARVVDVPADTQYAFTIDRSNISLCPINNGKVSLQGEGDTVYLITDKRDSTQVASTGVYASAYLLSKLMFPNQALQVLARLGDVGLYNKLYDSWTNAEFGEAENEILAAVTSVPTRYKDGKKVNCQPPKAALCLLQVLDMLESDEKTRIYVRHPKFSYKRTGVKREPLAEYPKFETNPLLGSELNGIVMHEERLNLSISVRIPGTVDLGDDAAKHGLARSYPTFEYRTYTIVKDGMLNVTDLVISASDATISILEKYLTDNKDGTWTLRCKKLPIINRKMVEETQLLATDYADLLYSQLQMQAGQKVLNSFIKALDPDKDIRKQDTFLTKETVEFLESKGIGSNGYSPKMTSGDVTDFYLAPSLSVKIDKMSSLPSANDVVEKIKSGKALTAREELLEPWIILAQLVDTSVPSIAIARHQADLRGIKSTLRGVRQKIQERKFALLVGKRWFSDLSTREDAKITANKNLFTFTMRDVKVEY